MDHALTHLGSRQRTVKEMTDYLDEKNFGEADVDATVERLIELGLLDDRKFADDFIRTRLASKPISRRHLREQLQKHRVDRAVIDDALSVVDDALEQQNADAVMQKYDRQLSRLSEDERRERCGARLLARGFSYECTETAWRHIRAEEME